MTRKSKYQKSDEDFKQDAVALVFETGKPIAQVARGLGINDGTLGNCVGKVRQQREGGEQSLGASERVELARLRKEKTELRMQRHVPKRSVALWAGPSTMRTFFYTCNAVGGP